MNSRQCFRIMLYGLFFLTITNDTNICAKPAGLVNFSGHNCYANASLQCLMNIVPFNELMKTFTDTNNILSEYSKFLQGKTTHTKFCAAIEEKIAPNQKDKGEQDAADFLREIFKEISLTKKNDLENIIGVHKIKVKSCTTCHKETITASTDLCTIYPVSITDANQRPLTTLDTCLMLEEAVESKCDSDDCSKMVDSKGKIINQPSKKHTTFDETQLPPFIIFDLHRFAEDGTTRAKKKLLHAVTFPIDLNLAPYCNNKATIAHYQLVGIVVHIGGLGGGHYWAYIKHDDGWWECNDTSVTEANEKVTSLADAGLEGSDPKNPATPYILFYHKIVTTGGGSGTFFPLGSKVDNVPLGVKIFKETGKQLEESNLEYAVWENITDQSTKFRALIKDDTNPALPAWWKESMHIVSKILYKEDNINNSQQETIKSDVKNYIAAYNKKNPSPILSETVLIMENLGAGKTVFSCKASNINNRIADWPSNWDKKAVLKKVGELFLLMTILGITIDDSDLFITKNNDHSFDVQLIDFGECTVFNGGKSAKTAEAYSREKTSKTFGEISDEKWNKEQRDRVKNKLMTLWEAFDAVLKNKLPAKDAEEIRESLKKTYVYIKTKDTQEPLAHIKTYNDIIENVLQVYLANNILEVLKESFEALQKKLGEFSTALTNLKK